MTVVRLAFAFAVLAIASPLRADPGPDWGASVRLSVGSVSAPFYTDALPEVSSEFTQARLMVLEGFYRITRRYVIGGRLPAAPSTVRQPAGSYSDDKAFGNPEIYIEDDSLSMPLGRAVVVAAARVGVGVPLAEHGSSASLLQNRVVALSNALDGWRSPELYEPGVIPVTASARAAIAPQPWGVAIAAKIPLMIRVSDASLPAEADTHRIGITPSLEARGSWRPLRWLEVDLAGSVAVFALPAVSPAERSARSGSLQLGVEPGLVFHVGNDVAISTRFCSAVGGPLSGTYGIGLGVVVER